MKTTTNLINFSATASARAVTFAFITIVILFSTNAFTKDIYADKEAEAKAAFIEGFDLFNKGEYQKAADKFREAHRINPSWKLYYNIGQAEAAFKRYGVALAAFESYLASGGDEIDNSRQIEVQEEIYRLRNMVGFIEVKTSDGATITIDGLYRGKYPVVRRIPVSAAVIHDVELVDREGHVKKDRIRVYGGDTVQLIHDPHVTETTAAELATSIPNNQTAAKSDETYNARDITEPKSRPPDNRLKAMRIWGWSSIATGGALMLAGSIAGSLAMSKEKELEDNCTDAGCYSGEYDLLDSRNRIARASTVLLVTGAAVAITGTILLIVVKKKKETPHMTMIPTFTGVLVSGRF